MSNHNMISVTNLHGNVFKTKHKQLLSLYCSKTKKTNEKTKLTLSLSLSHTHSSCKWTVVILDHV